jgi:hypothetical protein
MGTGERRRGSSEPPARRVAGRNCVKDSPVLMLAAHGCTDANGFNIRLETVPLDGRITLHITVAASST